MTRLPADDSFFPSPALDTDHLLASASGTPSAQASSSVISPLSLPGAAHYFDQSRPLPGPNHHCPRMTGETCGPPQAQPPNFLSPHLTPIPSHAQYQLQFQRHPQQRAASLSPTRRSFARASTKMDASRSSDVDLPPTSAPGVPVPVDTISGTGSGLITIRRPAVRTTSENSSADSQSLSLEARMRRAWDEERRALQANRDRAEELYRDAIEALRSEHAAAQTKWEAERYQLQTQVTLLQNRLRKSEARWNEAALRGGGLDSRSISFQGSSSSQLSPTGQPDSFFHHDNNPANQAIAMDHEAPSKVIDVQEYHKDLEGIHLKVNAVKKATFTDTPSSNGSKTSSGNGSPSHTPEEKRELARERCARALKADPLSRLTMNAGHTPTVSMSFVSTGATNTVTSSGSNTPTLISGDGAISSDGNDGNDGLESKEPAEPVGTAIDDADHDPAIMEPSDEDPELKGPLTLRNIPAKDEIFLRKLSDKLEKVGTGEDATPTVLKDAECEGDEPSAQAAPVALAPADDSEGEEAEPEIPLKLRETSNFGKPLGSL
ncbi:hypothetical protein KVR01_003801 [Diaporthe batatas]|uniref:uncharacterized protein n=1 Tax=Diaporthe batatas TaxID=748121 RepID=UPI001D03D886|nr:uncharacterized protein KVR01_003801 [Diaporthe batatas]KAG8168112.1 hypothetical protein KVR01_003801 [Diaporthe batatas]